MHRSQLNSDAPFVVTVDFCLGFGHATSTEFGILFPTEWSSCLLHSQASN